MTWRSLAQSTASYQSKIEMTRVRSCGHFLDVHMRCVVVRWVLCSGVKGLQVSSTHRQAANERHTLSSHPGMQKSASTKGLRHGWRVYSAQPGEHSQDTEHGPMSEPRLRG